MFTYQYSLFRLLARSSELSDLLMELRDLCRFALDQRLEMLRMMCKRLVMRRLCDELDRRCFRLRQMSIKTQIRQGAYTPATSVYRSLLAGQQHKSPACYTSLLVVSASAPGRLHQQNHVSHSLEPAMTLLEEQATTILEKGGQISRSNFLPMNHITKPLTTGDCTASAFRSSFGLGLSSVLRDSASRTVALCIRSTRFSAASRAL